MLNADQPRQVKTSPSLAAVAICKNEEMNLPGLIANLQGWVDQIVIVDDGSTDQSREIAEAAGEKVKWVHHRMDPDFGYAGQRNHGIQSANCDWLLHMDCDERVPPALASEIQDAVKAEDMNGFRYQRLNYFLHRPMRHGGWTSWNRPQLARRGHHRFEGKLHEACVIEGGDARIGQLGFQMFHLNDDSFAARLRKSANYVEMSAAAYEANGYSVTGGRIFWRSIREFTKRYLIQRGFLDGTPGLIAALHSATAEFRAQALVWDRQHRIPRADLEADVAPLPPKPPLNPESVNRT
jgi:glycosyltransferase involved in cell wall biosynthesis